MTRSRKKGLGSAPASEAGKIFGVPAPLLLLGLVAAAGLAYANSGPDTPATQPATPGGSTTGGSTTATGGSSLPAPTNTTPATSKPHRAAVVKAADPLLYVFVNSFGGEGIFYRLKNKASLADGNGLERVATLANHEFAGFWNGKTWKAPDTQEEYIQLYQEVGNIGYNYWIQKSETVQVHSQAAQAGYGWSDYDHMSATSSTLIALFFLENYIL